MTILKSERQRGEAGSALLVVLLASSLLAALGLALAALGSVETVIASTSGRAASCLRGRGCAEGALADLLTIPSWSDVLTVANSRLQGHGATCRPR